MKLITYVCDRIGCPAEESIHAKAPSPAGWGDIQIQTEKGKTQRHAVLCPEHVAELHAMLESEPLEVKS